MSKPLPPLPQGTYYSTEQMRAYAQQAVEAAASEPTKGMMVELGDYFTHEESRSVWHCTKIMLEDDDGTPKHSPVLEFLRHEHR